MQNQFLQNNWHVLAHSQDLQPPNRLLQVRIVSNPSCRIPLSLCDSITRNTARDRHSILEATLTRFAEVSFHYRQHDENLSRLEDSMSRLETNTARHDEAIFRIEGSVVDLNTQMQLG